MYVGAKMRKILFKNLTGSDNRKRDLSIREIVEKDGIIAETERRCIYFVRGKVHLEHRYDIQELETLKKGEDVRKKKHFYIIRSHNTKTGEDKLTCKVIGALYVIVKQDVFCITFVHSFKTDLRTVSIGKKKT